MSDHFATKFGFLNLVSKNVKHHALLLPQIYSLENCKLLLEYIAYTSNSSVESVLSSPDNLFFTKFSQNEVPLKIGDSTKRDDGARLIIKFAQNTGFSQHKIIVVEDIEHATKQALNALLKIIEEPPQNTTFYLIYSNIENVMLTMRSRCYIVRENIDTKNHFETLADFFGFEKNYDLFSSFGYDMPYYAQHKGNLSVENILQKLLQSGIDDQFIENAMVEIEKSLHKKILNVKNVFDMQKITELQARFYKLKKACDILHTNKYTSLVELTEEINGLVI